MPIGKDIYHVLSKKWDKRPEKMARAYPNTRRPKEEPAQKFISNETVTHKPKAVRQKPKPKKISEGEEAKVVNAKAGDDAKRFIGKTKSKKKKVRAGDAAIKPTNQVKLRKCSVCKEPGHTKRNCPSA